MDTAEKTLTFAQKITLLLLLALLFAGLLLDYRTTLIILLTIITFFYFADIVATVILTVRSVLHSREIEVDSSVLENTSDSFWPSYSILCPLYRESNILENFVKSIEKIDYPKDRLECLLLLEEDDSETRRAADSMNLPPYFKIVVVPNSLPKTKPKACNYGLNIATGKYVVIYDAEDRPDRDQLKKAAIAFRRSGKEVACIQAKLNFYNQNQNLLTRLFTSEYTLWFDLVLPGLQAIDAPIPLGGTSNHFNLKVLRILNGWDPFNVTEDCELGLRLKKIGFKTEILNSTTWEEANPKVRNWLRQRSRWIKGYLQTFLVHSRAPFRLTKEIGVFNTFLFFLMTGFLPIASLLNPLLWLTTILYFVFRPELGPVIEQFYPSFLLLPALICLVVGNFIYMYNYLIATAKKRYDRFTKYGLLIPISWILISLAGWYAFFQLFFRAHYWEKTVHGLAIKEDSNV